MWLKSKQSGNNSTTDDELVASYRASGDRKALSILFDRYSHLVFGVCMKYFKDEDESKDATINIFEKLMNDLRRFEVMRFNFWLHTVSKNYCLMVLRSRKAMIRIDNEDGRGIDAFVENEFPDHLPGIPGKEDQLQLLEEAITNLDNDQRICIELFYLKKMCYQDVSELTGFDMNQVKSYIQNGKRNLKIYMNKRNHELYGE